MNKETVADRAPTPGERRVGVSFNPSGNPDVNDVKTRIAALIDDLMAKPLHAPEAGRAMAIALTELETASMWAVKALTMR